MPCNCDYMNPNDAEKNSRSVALLILYVVDQNEESYIHNVMTHYGVTLKEVTDASDNIYGNGAALNSFVQVLCKLCSDMSEDEQSRIIYDGRNPTARQLATWWDEHEEADRKRLAEEHSVRIKSKEYQLSKSIENARELATQCDDVDEIINTINEDITNIFKGITVYG